MTRPARRFALGSYALWLLGVAVGASVFFLVGVGTLLRDGYRRVAD